MSVAQRGVREPVASAKHLVAALEAAQTAYEGAVAQIFKDEKGAYSQKRSLSEFVALAKVVAAHLIGAGLKEGGRVGILSDNRPEWNVSDVAALMSRGTTVGFYTNDTVDDIAYKINDTEMSLLFVENDEKLATVLAIERKKVPLLAHIVHYEPTQHQDDRLIPFERLVRETDLGEVKVRSERIQSRDLCKIVYTSGTSGRPKGAMLTHWNLLANVIASSRGVVIEHGDCVISYLPNAHIFQGFLDYAAWLNGAALGYSNRKTLRDDLPKLRPTFFPGVPKVYKMLLQGIAARVEELSQGSMSLFTDSFQPEVMGPMIRHTAGLDRVKFFVSGAAKLDVQVARLLEEKLGLVIYEGYGLSETSPVISVNTPEARKLGTVGRPIEGVQVKIVDEERNELPVGERGEVAVKGENVFQGYLNHPEHNRKVLVDGWFYTGDRGMLDEEGYLTVYGRAGHRVKFANGEYYDLEEIGDKFIRDCRLIGQIVASGEQKDYPVALICLSEDLQVAQVVAQKMGIEFKDPYELVYHPKIVEAVKQEFYQARERSGKESPLEKIQKAIYLRPFSAENKEATTTQKTRVRYCIDKYQSHLDALYEREEHFVVLEVGAGE